MSEETTAAWLDGQIAETHERLFAIMNERRAEMNLEQKERYFAALSILAAKLGDRKKALREALRDAVPELMPYVSAEIREG